MTDGPDERVRRIFEKLEETYGRRPWNWHTRQTPFQILIATVLSQRTKDEETDRAARALFARHPTAEALAGASLAQIEERIRGVNYHKTKAQRIRQIARIIVDEHGGETPDDMKELMALPGVGRKTAGCVLVYGFGKDAIPVDTHVHRISNRLGLVRSRSADETERQLWKVTPEAYVRRVNELLVKHGQRICKPAGPLCPECPVQQWCPYATKMFHKV
jgi:endonuclease-3